MILSTEECYSYGLIFNDIDFVKILLSKFLKKSVNNGKKFNFTLLKVMYVWQEKKYSRNR